MELYDAWSTFLETGSIMDYLQYTTMKEYAEMKEDFPEYFDENPETSDDKGESGENTN